MQLTKMKGFDLRMNNYYRCVQNKGLVTKMVRSTQMQPGFMRSTNSSAAFLGGWGPKYLAPARAFSRTTPFKAVARENED